MCKLSERLLIPSSPEDCEVLQKLHFDVPVFYQSAFGAPAHGNEAQDTFFDLPPGKQLEDKFVIGYFLERELVGCTELLRCFPDSQTAYIGLLLVSELHQGRGFGRQILQRIFEISASWGCAFIRLAVISTNIKGYSFWIKAGFQEINRKPYPNALGPAIIMQRPNPALNSARFAGSEPTASDGRAG